MARKNPSDAALKELRAFGLAYPGAHTKSPWPGHLDLAVNDKTFAYLSLEGDPLAISCKLPRTSDEALTLPFTKPTEYGLGKSGWVSAAFAEDQQIPVDLLKQWIDESYRAQAPKRLSKTVAPLSLDAAAAARVEQSNDPPTAPPPKKPAPAPTKKLAKKKPAPAPTKKKKAGKKTAGKTASGKKPTKAGAKKTR
jgi:predicted DNA-binding protein (MmcQ/YjbR family)